jgi:type II secretory pathway pseudopilin PulG
LIELLTVIAIIGVLAAIIIPVVGKVRTTAKRTQGLNNLRQIMTGSLAYAQENRGRWFAEVGNAEVPGSFYVEVLSKYAFKSSGRAEERPNLWQDPLLNYQGGDMHYAALLIYFPKSNWIFTSNFAPYNNLNNAKTPSRTVLFADNWANKDVSEGYGGVMPWINNVGTAWDAFPSTTKGKQTPTDTNYGSTGGQIDLQRDPGQAKLGFIDGHVAIVKRQDLKHSLFDPRY